VGAFERNGCRLHYWTDGPQDGPPIVLTHGATADHGMFEFQVPVLAATGYRVVTWDVRGHGVSKPMGEFSVARAAEDLLGLLDELAIADAILVGQSMGGNITQEVLFNRPERVRAAVLIGSACNTGPLSWWERAQLRVAGPLLRAWPYRSLKKSIVKRSAVTARTREYLARSTGLVAKDEFFPIWVGTATCLHPERDYRIDVPLLLTRGEHDKLGNFKKAMPAWAARDHARYVIIPDAGHLAQQDNPEAFNRVLLDFLNVR
jgi:pimeloyl-ACP methyl ester carboxylesterase